MNYQKKLDLLLERALSQHFPTSKFIIAEQNPPAKGGFEFTPEPEEEVTTNNNKTQNKPAKKKVVKKAVEEPKPSTTNVTPSTTNVTDSSTTWQLPAKDSTAYQKAEEEKVQKFYNPKNAEHKDAWNGFMVYGMLIGLGATLLTRGYLKYKTTTDPEWSRHYGLQVGKYGQPFWPGWIRWFGGQKLQDLEDLKKFLNIERERGRLTRAEYDDFIRALRRPQDFIMRAKTFNEEIKLVKSGRQEMKSLIKKLPDAYRKNKAFTDALLRYDENVLAYGRPGGARVTRSKGGRLKTTAPNYATAYQNLSGDVERIDWPLFKQTFGNKFGKIPAFDDPTMQWPYKDLEYAVELESILVKATRSGDPIPIANWYKERGLTGQRDIYSNNPVGLMHFLGQDGKLSGGEVTKPVITINMHAFASSTILRNLETSVKNNIPCIEFHLKFQTAGKENLKKFLMSDEMTTIAGESYSSAEANAIIRKLESDGTNIVLPKKYTEPGAAFPDMNRWTADMKEIGLRPVHRNDANRKRQIAYAEIYKILRRGL